MSVLNKLKAIEVRAHGIVFIGTITAGRLALGPIGLSELILKERMEKFVLANVMSFASASYPTANLILFKYWQESCRQIGRKRGS